MLTQIRINKKKFFIYLFGIAATSVISISGFLVTLVRLKWITYYENFKTEGLILIFFLSLVIGILGSLFKIQLEYEERINEGHIDQPKEDSAVANAMISQIEEEVSQGNFVSAIRLGQALSRPLWLDGHYFERIRLGEIMFEVGSLTNNKKIQIQALIDDMGWTNVVLNKFNEAKMNIEFGIEIAKEMNDYYMMAKGNRHLSDINIKLTQYNKAESNLQEAERYAKKIINNKRREEMIAGLQYGYSVLYLAIKRLDEAEETCKNAQKKWEKIEDLERACKTYSQLGKILVLKGNDLQALSIFFKGLEVSRKHNRKDEIIKNLLEISKIQIKQGNIRDVERNLENALNLNKRVNLLTEGEEIRTLLKKVKTR